jgi:AraC family transcriptional regulator
MRLYEEFCRTDAESALAIEGLASAVLAQLIRLATDNSGQDDPRPQWLPALLDLLDERYLSPVRLPELAARIGVHPKNMSRAFHRSVGVTLTAYVRRRRIDWACERLITSDLPLSRIAMEAGFTDQAHFARLFKRATGVTPRAFRAARTTSR